MAHPPYRQNEIDARIWERVCNSFHLDTPFTLEEAGRAVSRLLHPAPYIERGGRAYSGSKAGVEHRTHTALSRIAAQTCDIQLLPDGSYVLPSQRHQRDEVRP